MSCSPQQLRDLLDEAGLRHWDAPDPQDGCLVAFVGQSITRPTILVHVRVDSDGTVLSAMVGSFLRVSDHPHLSLLSRAMLHEAWLTTLGQWEFDPRDGEVRVTVQLPLFDADPTSRQIHRVIAAAAHLADRAWPRFLRILESGDDPVLDDVLEDTEKELQRLQLRMQTLLKAKPKSSEEN